MLKRSLFASSALLVIGAISAALANAQSPLRDYRRAQRTPNSSTSLPACSRSPTWPLIVRTYGANAEFILEMMQRRGLGPRLLADGIERISALLSMVNGKYRARLTR